MCIRDSPTTESDHSLPCSTDLVTANGSSIKTFGKHTLPVSLGPGHQVQHNFWIATVQRPILGADFFAAQGLLIDDTNKQLLSTSSKDRLPAVDTKLPLILGLRLATTGPFKSILEQFPSLLHQNFRGEVKHNVKHYIPTTGPPPVHDGWMERS